MNTLKSIWVIISMCAIYSADAATQCSLKTKCIVQLFDMGVIQEGDFILKSGIKSPLYIDMRRIISYPDLYAQIVELMWHEIIMQEYQFVSGIPHAAVPLASGIALLHKKSMLMIRKEKKDHGSGRMVEGVYKNGETVLLIEDVITSGASILETADVVCHEGLVVRDVVVFLDREQGANERLAKKGITVHAVCTLSDMLTILERENKLGSTAIKRIKRFIALNQFS